MTWDVGTISGFDEMLPFLQLRYEKFVTELQWVPENPTGLDFDKYDYDATHIGVWKDGKAVATCRIIPFGLPWMLPELWPHLNVEIDPDSIELSRLSIASSLSHGDNIRAFRQLVQYAAFIVHQAFAYVVTTENRARIYARYGIVFSEEGRYQNCKECLVALKIDVRGTDWNNIAR